MLKKIKLKFLIINLFILLLFGLFSYVQYNKITDFVNFKEISQLQVKIIDLSQKLLPESIYSEIPCRKSAIFTIETTICVHDNKDIDGVSNIIWKSGSFEPHILSKII